MFNKTIALTVFRASKCLEIWFVTDGLEAIARGFGRFLRLGNVMTDAVISQELQSMRDSLGECPEELPGPIDAVEASRPDDSDVGCPSPRTIRVLQLCNGGRRVG